MPAAYSPHSVIIHSIYIHISFILEFGQIWLNGSFELLFSQSSHIVQSIEEMISFDKTCRQRNDDNKQLNSIFNT